MIVLNKSDLVSAKELAKVKHIIRRLNADAEIIVSTRANVPLKKILNTGAFNFEKAEEAPGWLKEIRGSHVPETQE